ncbi:hypothetical protein CC78DRAFT_582148 [Lojkania enalia]|uniref:Uncharacterized protein n=1 Tax=Lojkania enalia TaxID=147567 RepID=A0A9P4K640_9PLEO|nr:hypothetical protein CC78DRAFT_582148 [Didymosphaeria enalia]
MKTTILLSTLFALSLAGPLRPRQSNLQPFTSALGGLEATPVEDSGNADRPFAVAGDTFVNIGAALQRSCDQQFNKCADAANSGQGAFSVSDCAAQKEQCSAASQGGAQNANAGNGNADVVNNNGGAAQCTLKKAKRRAGNKGKMAKKAKMAKEAKN